MCLCRVRSSARFHLAQLLIRLPGLRSSGSPRVALLPPACPRCETGCLDHAVCAPSDGLSIRWRSLDDP